MCHDVKLKFVHRELLKRMAKMSETDDIVPNEQASQDYLLTSGIKRRVAYIASFECIQKCDCLPKAKGRVVYTILELKLDLVDRGGFRHGRTGASTP